MKIKATAALLMTAIAFPAVAQSTVTLYGLVDEGINYTNNVKGNKQFSLQSGSVQGSRWGMKGAEDLGGGLKAVFQLESGFNINNGKLGQGGLMFGRQAWIGIASDRLGSIRLGRQYDSVVDYLAKTTANGTWGGGTMSHPYDNDNTDNSFRVNNTVKYVSPELAGFNFGGTYSFSNDTNFAKNRQYSAGAQYTIGDLLLAMAYLQADHPSATAGGAINNGGDENFVGSKLRVFGAGATYTVGAAKIGLSYSNTYVAGPTTSGYVGPITPVSGTLSSLRYQNFEIHGKYQFTPAFFVGATYTYTLSDFNATTGKLRPNYQTVGLMADYYVSKRTDVYVQGAYQHVGGDRTGTVLDYAYVPVASDVSSNRNQIVARVALRHRF
ncbi:porin (plasmid) [Burkholderia sp. JP2-270]|uniref:porin n=1 Tax=Burkholderia sp. JP2-270 TaxID=2217913 RepID=UPI000DA3322D|nr:porin [Burkholderia sp. JP2-270]AWV05617.1 porin [Burkholderia sp. JP2-270]